jgi:hypothetical protein
MPHVSEAPTSFMLFPCTVGVVKSVPSGNWLNPLAEIVCELVHLAVGVAAKAGRGASIVPAADTNIAARKIAMAVYMPKTLNVFLIRILSLSSMCLTINKAKEKN